MTSLLKRNHVVSIKGGTLISELRCRVGRVRGGEYLEVFGFLLNYVLSVCSDNVFFNMIPFYKSL